jgi:hypothetical protein
MDEILASQQIIDDGFWAPRLKVNAEGAIFHQWEQLEQSGCIDNFRILAEGKEAFREGWFFADSDGHKWLDAAARVYASLPSPQIKTLMDSYIQLLEGAQAEDGYLNTYNQIHFPGVRWVNLQIEHELYTHGHLIEAGVSHFQATGERRALQIATKAADLLVHTFLGAGPEGTPGHEEIELALIRLYRATGQQSYLELAEHFIEQRGRIPRFAAHLYGQNKSVAGRAAEVSRQRQAYAARHPEYAQSRLPPGNAAKKPPFTKQRWILNALSGKYFQQHTPVQRQTVPVGHAVRFGYLETASAMLERIRRERASNQPSMLPTLQKAWDHLVARRMAITGGVGDLPANEGFGRDYELNPATAYNETCAALACMFWSWEMALLTGQARYSDLFEWQLYNAASVGMGLPGDTYLYNNPLLCDGGVTRKAWYAVPCCPSNLSRTWANLGRYVLSLGEAQVWLHQYIGGQYFAGSEDGQGANGALEIRIESRLPWEGKVKVILTPQQPAEFTLWLRIPGWCHSLDLRLNGDPVQAAHPWLLPDQFPSDATACGYDPRQSSFMPLKRTWQPGDTLELDFGMGIQLRATHPKVRATRGKVAITRGPLVYCLESSDNPGVDLFNLQLDPASLYEEFDPHLLGGVTLLRAQTSTGKPLTFIPYFLWGNRGESHMTVYIDLA